MQHLETQTTAIPVTGPEVEAILRLAQDEDRGALTSTTTADIAEALRIPEQDVLALLDRVRNQAPPSAVPVPDAKVIRCRDMRRAWIAGSVGVILLAILTGSLMSELYRDRERRQFSTDAINLGPPRSSSIPMKVAPIRTPMSFGIGGKEFGLEGPVRLENLQNQVESTIAQTYTERLRVPAEEVRRILARPTLSGQHFVQMPFDLFLRDRHGTRLRVPERTLPIFTGDDIAVEKRAREARKKILEDAFSEITRTSGSPNAR